MFKESNSIEDDNPMPSQSKMFINRLLEPKAMIFGLAVLQFLTVLMYVIHYEQNVAVVSSHWYPARVIYEPLLLLLAAGALLLPNIWGKLIAIVASGRVIYGIAYLGLVATSAAHDQPLFSWYVLRQWFVITYQAQPQYLLELGLGIVIFGYAIIACSLRMLLVRNYFLRSHSPKT